MTEIFDGRARAKQLLEQVKLRAAACEKQPKIVSFFWPEDEGSVLYTRKKGEMANKIGIDFWAFEYTFGDRLEETYGPIRKIINERDDAGIMIQKPTRMAYVRFWERRNPQNPQAGFSAMLSFDRVWEDLASLIPPERDVDCLTPINQEKLARGEKVPVLPATVSAVLEALDKFDLTQKNILILGKSDLLGRPLYHYWRALGYRVLALEEEELRSQIRSLESLTRFDVIVSATGSPGMVREWMIREGTIIVDVGEPRPDVSPNVIGKAGFLTPVPGGIGPMTIACLLQNSVILRELDGHF